MRKFKFCSERFNKMWYNEILNLKDFLTKEDFELLKKLNINTKKTKIAEIDVIRIKEKMNEYYDIRWLIFRQKTEYETTRLEYLQKKEEEIQQIMEGFGDVKKWPIQNIAELGIEKEYFESVYIKIEILEKAINMFYQVEEKKGKCDKKTLIEIYLYILLKYIKQDASII